MAAVGKSQSLASRQSARERAQRHPDPRSWSRCTSAKFSTFTRFLQLAINQRWRRLASHSRWHHGSRRENEHNDTPIRGAGRAAPRRSLARLHRFCNSPSIKDGGGWQVTVVGITAVGARTSTTTPRSAELVALHLGEV